MSILVRYKTSLFRTKESPLTISYPLEKSTVPNQTKVDNLVLAAGGRAGTGGHAGLFLQPRPSPISVVSLYSTFNVLFALGLGAGGTILPTSTFPHFRGQPLQYI